MIWFGTQLALRTAGNKIPSLGISGAFDFFPIAAGGVLVALRAKGEEMTLDFADPMSARDVFADRQVDILVNNAGIIRRTDSVEFSEADWDEVIDMNLKAVFFTCQAFAKAALPRGAGRIANIASLLSFLGGIRVPSYTASKHGVAGLTVTEKGYCHDPATGHVNRDHPDIRLDVARRLPPSAVGYLVLVLERRRNAGQPPFTVLCCDNLPQNGRLTRRVVIDLAMLLDPALATLPSSCTRRSASG